MAETETAVFRVHIRGSIQAVWHEITKTDEAQGCMFNMMLHTDGLRPGGHIRMRTRSGRYTGVVGEVLEWNPPHRYSHTFRFTSCDDPVCRVIYDLKEVADGVEFTLTIEDLPRGTRTAREMTGGGKMIVNTLKAIVEKGRPPLFTRLLYRMFGMMEWVWPARCRSEKWPLPAETTPTR